VKYIDLFVEDDDEQRVQSGLKVLPDDSKVEGAVQMCVRCVGRDFDTMSLVMEESAIINHRNHEVLVRMRNFVQYCMAAFFRSWDLRNAETNEPLPLSADAIKYIHYDVAKALVKKWVKATGGSVETTASGQERMKVQMGDQTVVAVGA
jgi:hypothetical protein